MVVKVAPDIGWHLDALSPSWQGAAPPNEWLPPCAHAHAAVRPTTNGSESTYPYEGHAVKPPPC